MEAKENKETGFKIRYSRENGSIITILVIIIIVIVSTIHYYSERASVIKVKKINNLIYARTFHKVIPLGNNKIFISGPGIRQQFNKTTYGNYVEILDIKRKKSRLLFNQPQNLKSYYTQTIPVNENLITLINSSCLNEKGYKCGIEIFDKKTKELKILKTKPLVKFPSITKYNYSVMPDNKILIYGGKLPKEKTSLIPSDADLTGNNYFEIVDLKTDSKKDIYIDNANTISAAILPLGPNLVYVLGGFNGRGKYEFSTRTINLDTREVKKDIKTNNIHIDPDIYMNKDKMLIVDKVPQDRTRELKQVLNDTSYEGLTQYEFEKTFKLTNIEVKQNSKFIKPLFAPNIDDKLKDLQIFNSLQMDSDTVCILLSDEKYTYICKYNFSANKISYIGKFITKTLNPSVARISADKILLSGGYEPNTFIPVMLCVNDQYCLYKHSSKENFILTVDFKKH